MHPECAAPAPTTPTMRQRIARRGICRTLLLACSLLAGFRAFGAGADRIDPGQPPRRLLVGVVPTGEPLEGVRDGRLTGFSGDLLKQLFANSGVVLEARVFRRRDEMLRAACNGEIDLLMAAEPRPDFAHCLRYSLPYLERVCVVVTRKDDTPGRETDAAALPRVVVEAGSAWAGELRERYPSMVVTQADTVALALDAVAAGKADRYVGAGLQLRRTLAQPRFGTLHIAGGIDSGIDAYRFAVPARNAPFLQDLNRRLALLPDAVREQLRDTWFGGEAPHRAGIAQTRPASQPYSAEMTWDEAILRIWPFLALGGLLMLALAISHARLRQQVGLRERVERQLKDVTGNLPAVVFQVRRKAGKRHGEIVYAAGDGEGTLGQSAASLVGRRALSYPVFHRDYRRTIRQVLRRMETAKEPVEVDARLNAPDGRWVQIRTVARSEGGDVLWNGVIWDVTERHGQAEALREAKETAEAALHAKETFLAMMSHEIRTPMNGVLGLVELLENTPLTDEQRRMLALAKESGQALAQILDDILDYAKIEAGRLTISPSPLDLRELFDSVLSLLLPQAQKKGVQLRMHVDEAVPATVLADGVRVRQIVVNLFGNAIKFTDHGCVTLRAAVRRVDGDNVVVTVRVEDTGIGIPRADIQRLFAPFVQSERSSTRRFGGTGLGLTISRRLAGMIGGSLTLESEEGVGTAASLRFPCAVLCAAFDLPLLTGRKVSLRARDPAILASLASCARAAGMRPLPDGAGPDDAIAFVDVDHPEDAAGASHVVHLTGVPKQLGFRAEAGGVRLSTNPLRWTAFLGAVESLLAHGAGERDAGTRPLMAAGDTGARVLVVEDHPINREVLRQQLQLLGYASTVVENGVQAVEALGTERFDIVLTDYHMPEMDGLALTRAIRSSPRAWIRQLPVVGITATTVREEHLRCLEVGMNACVLKPTTLASLQQALAAARGLSPGPPMMASEAVGTALVRSLREDREALLACLEGGSHAALRAWCHRVSGALSMMGQPPIDRLMDRFHEEVLTGKAIRRDGTAAMVLALLDCLIAMLENARGTGHEGGDAATGTA